MRNNIIKRVIMDNFWLKILLAMINILNLLLIFLLDKLNFDDTSIRLLQQLNNLKILKSMIYVFIYKEKKN